MSVSTAQASKSQHQASRMYKAETVPTHSSTATNPGTASTDINVRSPIARQRKALAATAGETMKLSVVACESLCIGSRVAQQVWFRGVEAGGDGFWGSSDVTLSPMNGAILGN